MEDGLVLTIMKGTKNTVEVLILVVMEDGLVLEAECDKTEKISLNPCCNGRWSRTYWSIHSG